ncbi:MAG: hypothetical protein DME30_06775 [Verrucomicrobia bacterium]|nr:MAG: hypothetical protein DME30_06775 [Verrucomicrobiota bacterium]
MKMMDCSTLGMLVVNHEPIELIDVRSKNEFAAMHIPGARSIPFGELAAVDGGMKDWVARGFPVRPERFSLRVPTSLIAGATLIAAGVAVALHETLVATLLVAIAGFLLLKANFFRE